MTVEYCWFTSLKRAIAKNRRDAHNRYLQLATVRADGTPAVRTLVFRTLQHEPPQLTMVTDSRSDKPAEIAARPVGEICWYFTQTREQFRIGGTLTLIGTECADQTPRVTIWSGMSVAAREQFFWPHPKQPLDPDDNAGNETTEAGSHDDYHRREPLELHTPPVNFLIVTLHIERVDHLCLRGNPQTRWLSTQDSSGGWKSQTVNP